jgi:Right handed beta helix region
VWSVLVGLVIFTQVETVRAQKELYVDVAASPGGDGSKQAPFRRITDAVNYVRGFPLGRGFEILVEPGTYVGRYSNTDPGLEDLPIVLDYPNLKLKGSTSMLADENGLPTGEIEPGRKSLLIAQPPLATDQNLISITGTNPLLSGQGVEVSKLTLDGGNAPTAARGTVIFVRLVQDFVIRNNYVTGGAFQGIQTTASSGKIQGNYITQVGCGACIFAGSTTSPANVTFSGNRSNNNFFGGVLLNGAGISDPAFDRLSAVVDGNDLSDSKANPVVSQGFGVRVIVVRHDPPDQGTSGNVTATISNNRISNNRFGFSIDAGFPYRTFPTGTSNPDARLHNGTLSLSLKDNEVIGNLMSPALISFTRNSATLAPSQLTQWKYLEHSTFDITDSDGELNGYWLDHPVFDSIDGRLLQNILRINGVEISNGRYVPFP